MINRLVWILLILVPMDSVSVLPARAQRVVKKLTAECPMGYIDMSNGKCSALGLMSYTLRPAMDDNCPSGWNPMGGGYCRKD
ncbi:hypothetical protein MITS9509_00862 [Synechococcus sp. MIT S9509]|nr:hypothetical protein MITS9504_01004 [Synechococcus sp. MIT S9504]KZR92989.1 hypothetical protein MITS9509_00862 [Synechococcus sp. MIT S9509]